MKVILEELQAKSRERVWLRNSSDGDIDETKLVEGTPINIYLLHI